MSSKHISLNLLPTAARVAVLLLPFWLACSHGDSDQLPKPKPDAALRPVDAMPVSMVDALATLDAGSQPSCTSDGQCQGRCVNSKCVECKADQDCVDFGVCYETSRENCLGQSDCPFQTPKCQANQCKCRDMFPNCGVLRCAWKFK